MHIRSKCWAAPLLGVMLLAMAGCDGLLDETPRGNLASSNYYQNAADALTALNGAYQALHDGGSGGYLVGRNYVFMLETPTPQTVAYSGASSVRGCWDVFACSATNDEYARTSWNSIYAAINRANAVIDNVPKITDMDPALRARVVAEAKFLRALHYFNLVRIWGGVPLKLDETNGLTDLAKPRNSADEVYEQVIKDLQDAAKDLPVSYPANDFGRATQGAALTLLGKAYLQRGVVGKTNPFNDNLFWPTAQASDIGDAITALRSVTGLGYSLVSNYGDLWNEATEQNSEVIFSVQNMDQPGQGMDVNQYLAPRNSGWINTWTSAGAELPFYQSYPAGDKRKSVTWLTEYPDVNNKVIRYDESKPTSSWPGPSLRKYLIERRDVKTNPRDLVVLRYADVLLSLAEALYDQSPGSTEALALVNQVRARAGIAPLTALSREAIYQERNWELATEQKGWFDGQRFWDLMTRDILANAQLGKDLPGKYPRRTVPEITPEITEPKSRLMPIPQEAIDRNPQLKQNPGY